MFFEQIIDEWGGILYIPTKEGEALLTVAIAIMLLFAMIGIQISGQRASIRKLAYCAFIVGLGTLLANFNIDISSAGGNISLFSMLTIALVGYWYGVFAGVATGMAYGIFQMLIDPYLLFPSQVLVDYILAFGALGISGFFCNKKNGLIIGYIAGVLGRYFFAFFSGAFFFGEYAWEGWNPITYSLAYNGLYIFPEALMTIALLLIPAVRKNMEWLKAAALETRRDKSYVGGMSK